MNVDICYAPKRARIVFTTSGAWHSWVIRRVLKSKASHVALQFEVFGQDLLFHADTGGIQMTPRSKFLARGNTVVGEFELTGAIPKARVTEMIEELNAGYDYPGLFGFVWVMVARLFGWKTRNPLADHTRMVCSEFVARLDPEGRVIRAFEGLSPEETTPQDLWYCCQAAVVQGDLVRL